jgi:hypothetical protein
MKPRDLGNWPLEIVLVIATVMFCLAVVSLRLAN